MKLREIIACFDAVSISANAIITQLKHEEDGEMYQVWRIDDGDAKYILKEAKERETETYQTILAGLGEGIPALYQAITHGEKTYLLMEYIAGEDLCKCDRRKLTRALDALICLQKKTWENSGLDHCGYCFDRSLSQRRERGRYLRDEWLEKVYEQFLQVYQAVPRALCHDDLLPFNVIASEHKAVLIDWEFGGILPYPVSFARLIAHGQEDAQALFYMTREDRDFAVEYYYDRLLKEKGISRAQWRQTLEYFLFYEYCEWVFVGNKYQATDGEYYRKYLPMAKQQAIKILQMEKT